MKVTKLILLQVLALMGLLIGSLITPEQPLYPSMPIAGQDELIKYTESHIILVTGFVVAFISVAASKVLKLHFLYGLMVTIIAGVFIGLIDSFRVGEMPSFKPILVAAYFFGLASLFGVIKVVESMASIKRGRFPLI